LAKASLSKAGLQQKEGLLEVSLAKADLQLKASLLLKNQLLRVRLLRVRLHLWLANLFWKAKLPAPQLYCPGSLPQTDR
jgi:hypothetical protein